MALTELQRDICRLIAGRRIALGESYVAGGTALGTVLRWARISRAIDLFHDTEEALQATWAADRAMLDAAGFTVEVKRERPGFVDAVVRRGGESVLMQWVRDSAYRFFPLVEHEGLGLTLHPFDLATNKVLALVGRLEVRDWVDTIECSRSIQHLGYLAWAACGKDPGFSPATILQEAHRSSRYSVAEVAQLAFAGDPPDAAALSREWRRLLDEAEQVIDRLPPEEAGKCVIDRAGRLLRSDIHELAEALRQGTVRFHAGSIRGALPTFR